MNTIKKIPFILFCLSLPFIATPEGAISRESPPPMPILATDPDQGLKVDIEDPASPEERKEEVKEVKQITPSLAPNITLTPTIQIQLPPSSSPPPSYNDRAYSLEDLKVLAKEKNFKEFFSHALDIKPASRKGIWPKLVKNMAEDMLEFFIQTKSIGPRNYDLMEKLLSWPLLKEHEPFLNLRSQIGPLYFASCFEEKGKICLKEMENFWNRSKKIPYLGVHLGELALFYAHTEKDLDYWFYFDEVIKNPRYANLCEKDSVRKILWSFFENFLNSPENDNPKLIELHLASHVSSDCFKSFSKNVLLNKIKNTGTGHEMAFRLLEVTKDLNEEEKNKYFIHYILKGPVNGPIFNQAWNHLKLLKKDSSARQKLMNELMKEDPLPGEVFSLADIDRRKILMGHLYENFPEYMDAYARLCLDYLQGKKEFPRGNPTLSCDDLFATVKNGDSHWLDKNLQYSYSLVPHREYIQKKKALQ